MKNISKIIAALLMAIILFALPCQAELSLTITENIISSYITKSGGKIGDGPVNQSMLLANFSGWYGYGWHNYNFKLSKMTEYDLVVGKWFAINNFIIDLSYQKWIGKNFRDDAVEASIKYNGQITALLVLDKIITEKLSSENNRFYFEIKKSFPIANFSITPTISTAYLNNFYNESGWAHITGGISGRYEFSKNFYLSAFIKYQTGFFSTKNSLAYGGTGLNINF